MRDRVYIYDINHVSDYQKVGNGWCLDKSNNRINLPGYSWTSTTVTNDGRAIKCEADCLSNPKCIGYMSEDGSKCDVILNTDINAQEGIFAVDGERRNYCWRNNNYKNTG